MNDLKWWNTMDTIFPKVRVAISKIQSRKRTLEVDVRRVIEMLEQLSSDAPAETFLDLDLLTHSRPAIVIRLLMFTYRAQLAFVYLLRSTWQALELYLVQRHKLRRPLTREAIRTPEDACPTALLF